MKKALIIISSCILSFVFSSCSDKSEKTSTKATSPTIHTLLFFDKTKSVDISKPFVAQKYEQAIASLVQQNVQKIGDQVEVYYIHENTAKSRTLSLTSRTEMEDINGMSATDQDAAKTNYELSIKKEQGIFLQQTLARLKTENTSSSNKETDILGSLSVIAKASENGGIVKVYFFSDMVESMNGAGKRDFQTKPPKDNSEAENWAKEDAVNYKNLVLNNAEITMILPFEPTSSTKENNPTVTHYWQKLFEKLGVTSVSEL